MATAAPVVALHYADGALRAVDQTQLPWHEVELELRCADDVVGAIRRLSIRGAPLIGVAAAYGVALELARDAGALDRACAALAGARPTAVNLAHAVDRVRAAVLAAGAAGGADRADGAGAAGRAGPTGPEPRRSPWPRPGLCTRRRRPPARPSPATAPIYSRDGGGSSRTATPAPWPRRAAARHSR